MSFAIRCRPLTISCSFRFVGSSCNVYHLFPVDAPDLVAANMHLHTIRTSLLVFFVGMVCWRKLAMQPFSLPKENF